MTQSESNIKIIEEWLSLLNQTQFYDDTLTELIKKFPDHNENSKASIGIKVATIDSLMKTRLSLSQKADQIEAMINKIACLKNLDDWIKNGSAEAVDAIAKASDSTNRNLSFATKYCYWHSFSTEGVGQEKFVIFDNNVFKTLNAFQHNDGFLNNAPELLKEPSKKQRKNRQHQDIKNQLTYQEYLDVFTKFITAYGLKGVSSRCIELALYQCYRLNGNSGIRQYRQYLKSTLSPIN